jgi:hypothetical protein
VRGRYPACFRVFENDEQGAAAFITTLYQRRPTVLAAAGRGDLWGVSATMYDTLYYEGNQATREGNIRWHTGFVSRNIGRVAEAMGEPQTLSMSRRVTSGSISVPVVAVAAIVGYGLWYAFKRGM